MAAPPTTVDQKLSFAQCDAQPSYEAWVALRRNFLRFGTKTCKRGWSLADCSSCSETALLAKARGAALGKGPRAG